MEALNIQKYPVPGRIPLSDGSAIANVLPREVKAIARPVPAPAGKSVAQNEFAVGKVTPLPSSKHQRVSAIAENEIGSSNRNSTVSTASTNASGVARRRKTHIGPWQLGQTIGKGGTSRVRKVRHSITGEPAVAKIIPKAVADKNCSMSLANLVKCAERGDPSLDVGKIIPFGLEREIVIMKLLDHRNIVRLFDVWENRNEL
jgi:serine/threonine protein kinase